MRLDDELDTCCFHSLCKSMKFFDCQSQTKMWHRDFVTVNRIVIINTPVIIANPMHYNLMSMETKILPCLTWSPLFTSNYIRIELFGGFQVTEGGGTGGVSGWYCHFIKNRLDSLTGLGKHNETDYQQLDTPLFRTVEPCYWSFVRLLGDLLCHQLRRPICFVGKTSLQSSSQKLLEPPAEKSFLLVQDEGSWLQTTKIVVGNASSSVLRKKKRKMRCDVWLVSLW